MADAKWPIGKNAKLNELMTLMAVAAANESGSGYDLDTIKRHADHAAKLWENHTRQPPSYRDEATDAADAREAKSNEIFDREFTQPSSHIGSS